MLDDKASVVHDATMDAASSVIDVDLKDVSSVALARIIEEVRNDDVSTSRVFDRVHNRHNR